MAMRSTTPQALVAGAIAGVMLMSGIVGCSSDRTRVRRTTEIVRDQPPAPPPPAETVIRKDSTYERTVEDR
jgi:hypothetical protein